MTRISDEDLNRLAKDDSEIALGNGMFCMMSDLAKELKQARAELDTLRKHRNYASEFLDAKEKLTDYQNKLGTAIWALSENQKPNSRIRQQRLRRSHR